MTWDDLRAGDALMAPSKRPIVDLWDKHDSITAGWYSANPNGTIDGVRISQRWCVANKKQYVPLDQRLCRTLTVEEAKAYLITAVSMLEDT